MKLLKWLILLLVLFIGCKKKDAPADPCSGQHPTSADFTIQEVPLASDSGWVSYTTDSVCTDWILFTANENNATYEWHIGSRVYTTQSFQLNFANVTSGTTIPIELIVHKQPNLSCFPADKGVDTLIKNMYYNSFSDIVNGSYFGSNTNGTSDTFTVILKTFVDDSLIPNPGVNIYNLIRGQTVFCGEEVGYKELLFGGTLKGGAILGPDNNEITINYQIFDAVKNLYSSIYTFKGKRVK